MKKLLFTIVCFVLFCQNVFSQDVDKRYVMAYKEMTSMLEGITDLSIKRAVFLSEWAYLDGNLDYEKDFCEEINRVSNFINSFISVNHLEKYKTAKQMALCEYFLTHGLATTINLIPTILLEKSPLMIGEISLCQGCLSLIKANVTHYHGHTNCLRKL